MTRCELLAEGPRRHFMTRRFDRDEHGARRHVLSLAALAHLDPRQVGAHSYDQYLGAVRQLGLGLDGLTQAFRRMVVLTSLSRQSRRSREELRVPALAPRRLGTGACF